jgi:hypothetical protein
VGNPVPKRKRETLWRTSLFWNITAPIFPFIVYIVVWILPNTDLRTRLWVTGIAITAWAGGFCYVFWMAGTSLNPLQLM